MDKLFGVPFAFGLMGALVGAIVAMGLKVFEVGPSILTLAERGAAAGGSVALIIGAVIGICTFLDEYL